MTYTNPVFDHNAPDPSVIRGEDGAYYAYTTNSSYGGKGLTTPVIKSTDLTHWKLVGDAFPDRPSWVRKDMWAPHIAKTGDHYTLLYSGRADDGKMRVGYATANTPTGPFQDRGVLVSDKSYGYDIDPYLLQDGTKTYMYWGSGPQGLTGQEMKIAADGSMSAVGDAKRVLTANHSDAHEALLTEGSWVTKHDNMYYLMYSAGNWRNDYVVRVARSASPLGPFEEQAAPLMHAGAGFTATGHHSVISDASGQDWMLYHAFVNGHADWGRALLIDKIDWKNGWPVVNGGKGPTHTPQTAPVTDAMLGAREAG